MAMKLLHLAALSILTFSAVSVEGDAECVPRTFGHGSIVCVCNATYCDEFESVTHLPKGQYVMYTSTKEGLRFNKTIGSFSTRKSASCLTVKINRTTKYQTIKGFGTAFTDAAGINVLSLSSEAQQNLMRSYFAPSGIRLNMGRVPIAGCDFSTHVYTYDDYENDTLLTNFNLTWEDHNLKIPLIKWAQDLRNKTLKLKAAAWSPPTWMKTNHNITGVSLLEEQYYQTWADYHIKFLDAYKKSGLKFWAVSTGNEPANGVTGDIDFNSLGWTTEGLGKWIVENFGPSLRASQHKNIKLLLLDDQRPYLEIADMIMRDKRVQNYVHGIAVHWYYDMNSTTNDLTRIHEKYPSKFLIATEASIAIVEPNVSRVKLGKWERGESYMADMIEDLAHWVTGWIDWNMALNPEGGPNWAENYVDASVIVNATNDEFYKQPMFYAIGHHSKFLPEDSVRISIEPNNKKCLKTVAFVTPDKATVIIMLNQGNHDKKVTMADPDRGYATMLIRKRSFNTIVYW